MTDVHMVPHRKDGDVEAVRFLDLDLPSQITYPFTPDMAGLVSGVPFYIGQLGQMLVDGWIRVDELFDGDTPSAGVWAGAEQLIFADLTLQDRTYGPLSYTQGRLASLHNSAFFFASTDPLMLVVSNSGNPDDGDPHSTTGRASVTLMIRNIIG